MKVISVNAGSSSLKFRMFEMPEEKVLIKGVFERIGINNSFYTIEFNSNKIKKEVELKNHEDAVKILMQELLDNNIISSLSELSGVSHRLVHGGDKYPNSCILNEEVIKEVESIKDLAPLHVPANLMCVKAFMKEVPNTIQVGCFDTAFHQTLEEDKYIYPIPYSYYIDYKVRKYGFHGMSYKYITETMKEKLNKDSVNLIVCHIGQGASISAIKDNKSYDTSMGFTPNSGIVMGTRSGDIDYGIIKYMMNNSDKSFDDIDKDLNKKSGLYGISMVSSDWRDVDAAIKEGNKNAKLAHYVFVNSIVSYGIIEDDYIIFGKKLQIIAKKLEKVVANIPLVDDPNSPLAWNTAAIMKRKFGDLPDGKKQFEDWLQKEQDLFFSKIQD